MNEKKKLIWLGILVAVAAGVWYAQRANPVAAGGSAVDFKNVHILAVDNPDLHFVRMQAAQKTEYQSSGRNIFSEIIPPKPPTPQEIEDKRIASLPTNSTPTPVPPPVLPAKYFGYGTIPNGTAKRAFLTNGDDVYIVAEGDTLLSRFRILKINNTNLEFEEISSGRRNTAPLEDQGTGAPAT